MFRFRLLNIIVPIGTIVTQNKRSPETGEEKACIHRKCAEIIDLTTKKKVNI